MKESVLDVLMYLFEHYLDEEAEFESDQESLRAELVNAGFPDAEIGKAFAWLEGLTAEHEEGGAIEIARVGSVRIYTAQEMDRLDTACRGFLLFLEQVRVLDGLSRELVIDRVMALEDEEIDLDQLKWVVLMVLFNQPGHESAYAWMEDLVIDHAGEFLN
ncbi:MAG: Smg protein [Gammaproteobacteria bacterium]|jgi:Smg protein